MFRRKNETTLEAGTRFVEIAWPAARVRPCHTYVRLRTVRKRANSNAALRIHRRIASKEAEFADTSVNSWNQDGNADAPASRLQLLKGDGFLSIDGE